MPHTTPFASSRTAAPSSGAAGDPAPAREEAGQPGHAAGNTFSHAGASFRYRDAVMVSVLDSRPLLTMSNAEFEGFLYASRMYPSRSRFMPGNAEWVAPRRDITVRVALETLRERLQQSTASIELVARLERDHVDENPLPDDDEALIVAAAVRDNLREALGMLGVVECALELGAPSPGVGGASVHQVREPEGRYALMAA